MNIGLMIIIGAVLGIIAVATGVGIWVWTRPKKMIWRARVYTVSDSMKKIFGSDGKIIENLQLKDLQPFCSDVLEKVEIAHAVEIYRLQKLGKTTPAVTNDCVEKWGDKGEVKILLHNNTCTILKSGFDGTNQIFSPVPYDNQNMVKNEIANKKSRLKREKDILEAIAPYIAIGLAMMFLFGVIYVFVSASLDMNKEFTKRQAEFNAAQIKQAEIIRDGVIQYGELQQDAAIEYGISITDLNRQISQLEQTLTKKINSSN